LKRGGERGLEVKMQNEKCRSQNEKIWGDFSTKDGAFGQAWNTGFGFDPIGVTFTD
jgi:hypothetical protein